jgi:hypothetical protein
MFGIKFKWEIDLTTILIAMIVSIGAPLYGAIFALISKGFDSADAASWVQAAGSVIAIWAAVGVAYWQHKATLRKAERDDFIEIRGMLRSIKDEVALNLADFQSRNAKALMEGSTDQMYDAHILMPDRSFPIYEAVVGRIGKIENDELRSLIIQCYGLGTSFIQSIKTNNRIIDDVQEMLKNNANALSDPKTDYEVRKVKSAKSYAVSLRESFVELETAAEFLKTYISTEINRMDLK